MIGRRAPGETIAHFHDLYRALADGVTTSIRLLSQGQRLLGRRPLVISGSQDSGHYLEKGARRSSSSRARPSAGSTLAIS